MSTILCFAHGQDDAWEAICTDFDIAVQGSSFDEVQQLLNQSISSYIADAFLEEESVKEKLLNRRAPWYVIAALNLKLVIFNVFGRQRNQVQASFPVLCPV